jgi:hypothetical protein
MSKLCKRAVPCEFEHVRYKHVRYKIQKFKINMLDIIYEGCMG